ncbi:MAG: molecular chaperone TorD family protein [Aquificaceae bacterium]
MQEEERKSLSFIYYAFSEVFSSKDYYYLNWLCERLSNSDYSKYALEVLESIANKRLQEELEFLQEVSLLERDYRIVDKDQILKSYEYFGFALQEGYEPDHLGIELRFLALICLEEDQTKAYTNQYRFIHNRLGWLSSLEDAFEGKGFIAMKRVLSFLRAFLRDHKAFLMKELKIESKEES